MPTPDYALIARLERELGIGQQPPAPERPMRSDRTVCLDKDCGGVDTEYRTWSGVLMMRIHEH